MKTKREIAPTGLIVAGLMAVILGVAMYALARMSGLTVIPIPPTPTPTALPTLTLDQTSVEEFTIMNFDDVHSPVDGDANQFLIFGKLPVAKPAADLPASLAVFLGRWEGYSYAPPVKKDRKVVLVIQEITLREGKAVAWSGTNLQYPDSLLELHFRVVPGDPLAIEVQMTTWPGGGKEIVTFTYRREKDTLEGLTTNPGDGPYELTRDQSFFVYKDYAQYLAGKRIYSKTYQNSKLQTHGQGYLVYLPEGYEDQPGKTWPLLYFLHGYGDRGANVFLLAKASPFMFIREEGPLPFIIVAPLLNASDYSFPEEYMYGVLAEIQAEYRVDAKRIYVTGLSMGGEATYRFAVHQPELFAAIAPLSAYAGPETLSMIALIKDLPIWAIHGADDIVVPLTKGQQPVDALKAAGGNIRFTVLAGHDHDTWTDTYSDQAFYDWFLQHQRP
jgi:dienelactone hydrolase